MPPKQGQNTPHMSVVIPAFNEEDRLGRTLTEASLFFSIKPYVTEIIVVDDGSKDKTIKLVMKAFNDREMRKLKNIKPYLKRHTFNQGKGAAVQTGIKAASGSHVLIIDADGATPISEFDKLYKEIHTHPIVIGSRDIGSEDRTLQGILRKVIGKTARMITKLLFNLPVSDTQCGFKIFETTLAKQLAEDQITKRFGFDVEYLVKAHKRGAHIKEVGIRWHDKAGGKVDPIKDSFRTLKELLKIKKHI
ncbi:MAG: glycosyltransferase family 2 protein [Candidatus Taylorbacteria bacterium]|nr:glycosyltransferase family 2 protein [Candidatus Taylorbacteria bacterium]